MRQGAAFRGQPLLLLAGLLAGWMGLRVALWQPPFEPAQAAQRVADAARGLIRAAAPVPQASLAPAPASDRRLAGVSALRAGAEEASRTVPAPPEPGLPAPLEPLPAAPAFEAFGPVAAAPARPHPEASPRAVIGHNLLLMAGLSQMEVPPALLAYLQAAQRPAPGVPAAAPLLAASAPTRGSAAPRWSADAWLLLRQDGTTPLLSGRPSYGRSQAGGVIRYRLASASALRPQAYLRASAALAGAREQELAAGVSARLLPAVPLRFAVEARAGETARGTRLRPAAYAVTEFPPLALPLGARAEAYVQAGYVGGDYATAFADGQARIERPLARFGETELTAGAGAWGGAQRDAARLDIGPTAALSFRLGGGRGRVAADYRFRVAGDAEPSSGPALTLSAGF